MKRIAGCICALGLAATASLFCRRPLAPREGPRGSSPDAYKTGPTAVPMGRAPSQAERAPGSDGAPAVRAAGIHRVETPAVPAAQPRFSAWL